MRQCIFCMQWKEEKEFNREHIILEALGGKGDKDICLNVCTTCNSSLGTRVDASLLNQDITKYMRYKFKIKGKNGVPNPFRGVEIKYADTPIIGELKVNKEGKIDGFRAKYQDHSGVRYSKEDIKRRKVERKFDKRCIKKNWRLQTPVKKQ